MDLTTPQRQSLKIEEAAFSDFRSAIGTRESDRGTDPTKVYNSNQRYSQQGRRTQSFLTPVKAKDIKFDVPKRNGDNGSVHTRIKSIDDIRVDNDMLFRVTQIPVNLVARTCRTHEFGFVPYEVPVDDHKYKIPNMAKTQLKRSNFADEHARSKSWVPGPKYLEQKNWKTNFKLNRGCFLKKPKRTFTAEIMEQQKKTVAPNAYEQLKF